MPGKRALILLVVALFVVVSFLALTEPAFAVIKEKVLWSFDGLNGDGLYPQGGVIFDAAGNLYGTTAYGGGSECDSGSCGAVFELSPSANGAWTETLLHRFSNDGADGQFPCASLIFDAAGNLYGTTSAGGAYGGGTVFQLAPGANGSWKERVLHNFGGLRDGQGPFASLIFDAAGNLYGTTRFGGADGEGAVFELSPGANGKWREKVLHSFQYNGKDGYEPIAGLIFDTTGNLYGSTFWGGSQSCGDNGCGTVFELTPGANGSWKEKVLHTFEDNGRGNGPSAVIFDSAGKLYGTTQLGGKYGYGTVFQLAPGANGEWTEKLLRSFYFRRFPTAGLIFDGAGNLYGATIEGGGSGCLDQGCGTVFQFAPGTGGKWTYKVLFSFNDNDGWLPLDSLILDANGNLYGTTEFGGTYDYGTVFELTP